MSQNNDDLLLEIRNLKVEFRLFEGVVTAVQNVNLRIKHGKTLGIIGESGSGKSVTAQAILRLIPSPPGKIVQGEIQFNRELSNGHREVVDLATLDPFGREIRSIRGQDISMVFQEPMTSFGPLHTIGNQIIEVIKLHEDDFEPKAARQRVIDLLKSLGIPNSQTVLDYYPHQLSGGMRQRAMIAMAIVCNPVLLLADEPTTALDVTVQAQILGLLVRLKEEYGMSMMFISHDLSVVAEISDDIAVMYLGRIVEYASAEEIITNPLHPYTKALSASIPRIDGDIKELVPISGSVPSPYNIPKGCPFWTRCPEVITGVCDVDPPPVYQEISSGHWVSCHLYE